MRKARGWMSSKTFLTGAKSRCSDKESNGSINRVLLLLACPQLPFKGLSCPQNILLNYHNQTDPLWISLLNALTPLASAICCGTDLYGLTTGMCKEVFYLASILWQTDSLSAPQLSCSEKIIISIYFMCAGRDIWVLNQRPLIHFLSHLNSHGLLVWGDIT